MGIVFDRFYEGYDAWYGTPVGAFVDGVETQAAFELLEPKGGMKILDLGCGTGNFSLKLAAMGCQVTGVDISRQMLAQARQKAEARQLPVTFLEMDGSRLDFADNSFDGVLSMAAFEFIPNPQAVYDQLRRVVRPGGVIVLGTIQQGGAWAELYGSPACAGTAYEQAVFLGQEQLQALDAAGVTGVRECLFVPPGLGEEQYTPEAEERGRAQGARGGFVCVQYRKA